jgi:hypothetical protein
MRGVKVIFISEQDFNSQDVFVTLPESPSYYILTYNVDGVQTPYLYILPHAKNISINKHVALEKTPFSIHPLIFISNRNMLCARL